MSGPRITTQYARLLPAVAGGPRELFTTLLRPTKYALRLAILKVGGERQLGLRLGVSQQAVHKWVHRDEDLPLRHWDAVIMYAQAGEFL